MDPLLVLVGITFSALLMLLGYLVKYKQMYLLISGYNTMSSKKKQSVDIKSIANLMFRYMVIASTIILIATLAYWFELIEFAKVTILFFIPVLFIMIIHLQKHDGNNFKNGKIRFSTILIFIIIFIIMSFAEIMMLIGFFIAK